MRRRPAWPVPAGPAVVSPLLVSLILLAFPILPVVPILQTVATASETFASDPPDRPDPPDSTRFFAVVDEDPFALGPGPAGESIVDEVEEPFFVFLLTMIEADSVGFWTGGQLQAWADTLGRPSKIPLAHVVSLERRVAEPAERQRRNGIGLERIWTLVLDDDLKTPMPYSILGYNPGDLYFSSRITASEWRLGQTNFHVQIDDFTRVLSARGLTVLRLDSGKIVLDVDALIDRLLGKGLDDAWTTGFAVGRIDGRLVGLGLSRGRSGRKIYGEFDLAADKVIAHGRPLAATLSRFCRPWAQPSDGQPLRAWQNGE